MNQNADSEIDLKILPLIAKKKLFFSIGTNCHNLTQIKTKKHFWI